ncbi:transporter substrate-binding domain-containing protein [Cocleimonas sp. KMM 6892]|uniref:substrate-binding periplasmic protein n=1 Tax=unclassified Cocleimonas TaxID=2639732 RepID=UPI002DBDE70F|nr:MULTISPECIES: transporter substrate-binding domain-containing protein [unclassified Cocleimonas]MEB8433935.1 transporter substrate-binding domain-containing protein [Cocleimonas sp. KMM 6892]MEC4716746.1 transporter substrate-binding domain-containing protein [Cocleimonas sp. KMM 6895]MEC4746099.1 transporter substrate-binding domain-containing protein [Cocleimonas sp. KMM 6896]
MKLRFSHIVLFIFIQFIHTSFASSVALERTADNKSVNSAVIKTVKMITPSWDRYTNEDGTGLYFDLFRKIYEPEGIQLEFIIAPWRRATHEVKSGHYDFMVNAYLTPQLSDFIYPKQPMNMSYTLALFDKNKFDWNGQKSIENKKVIWMYGYGFHKYLDVKVEWSEIGTLKQGWELLRAGRVDYFLDDSLTTDNYIKENNPDMSNIGKEVAYTIDTYPRFNNSKRSRELIKIYEKRMKTLVESGELRAIFKQWDVRLPPWLPEKV